jgi:hypothetical protein
MAGKNNKKGRGAGGAVSAADRKKALIRKASNEVLSGNRVSPTRLRYIRSQQEESLRLEGGGKGSKAARRIAALRG